MKEFSKELTTRFEEAAKDTVWAEKLRASATWGELEKVLAEKDISAPTELKEAFNAYHSGKTGKLEDDELEKVSGGFTLLPCPESYNPFVCVFLCTHLKYKTVDGSQERSYCEKGFWESGYSSIKTNDDNFGHIANVYTSR